MGWIESAAEELERAWNVWTQLETNLGVSMVVGRQAEAVGFVTAHEARYDLERAAGVVLDYRMIAKAQALAASSGCKAIAIVQASDGLWYTRLAPPDGRIEVPAKTETWPHELATDARLVYRVARAGLRRVQPAGQPQPSSAQAQRQG